MVSSKFPRSGPEPGLPRVRQQQQLSQEAASPFACLVWCERTPTDMMPPSVPAPPASPVVSLRVRDSTGMQVFSNILLFLLVASFAASTEYHIATERRTELRRGVAVAMGLQFLLLPFIGFCVVRMIGLDATYGIMIQVVTSCPGGAYSNWWCSLLNADLLLSVLATAVATALSAALMPLNLLIYLNAAYDIEAVTNLRFDQLIITIVVVIAAVGAGALVSTRLIKRIPALARDPQRTRERCGLFGNACGLCLILISFVFSSVSAPLWNRELVFYGAVAMPPLCALLLSLALASLPPLGLSGPARCAVVVECTFQNVGIGLAASLALFEGEEAARAAGVPLFYGLVQVMT